MYSGDRQSSRKISRLVIAVSLPLVSFRFLAQLSVVAVLILAGYLPAARADPPKPFQYESFIDLDDMRHFLESQYPLGSSRAALRKTFVDDGKGTLVIHPTQFGVEKYIYDINLCRYYVWRWNISADYDAAGHLLQSYVNGEPIFPSGTPKKDGRVLGSSGHASIYKVKRPRPEADLGEKELAFIVIDADSNLKTIDDQVLTGGGPTQASIATPGRLHMYSDVEPWRSIFDFDPANHIAPYPGDCAAEVARAQQGAATPK
jgi:hypothetical protein